MLAPMSPKYLPEVFRLRDGREVELRELLPADAPLYAGFRQRLAEETTHTLAAVEHPATVERSEAQLTLQAADPDTLHLGVFLDGRLVGDLGVFPQNRLHPWVRHTANFGTALLAEVQGQGLGRKLMDILLAFSRSHEFTRIEALCRTENERALKLYLAAGFVIEGVRRGGALIAGRYRDELSIALYLDERIASALTLELSWVEGALAVCRLAPDAALPAWFRGDGSAAGLWAMARTPAELSLLAPESALPTDLRAERGFNAFVVAGPLDFALTGVLAALAGPLALAGVSFFALSTFDTDYVLVRAANRDRAERALLAAGHRFSR
jgi:RimJ/RimL family protein N-acetyltransferase